MTDEIIAETQVETTRAAVRDWIDRCGASNAEIARVVGVDEKTVRHARADGWNPRVETLSRFEKLIPPGWQLGDPVPVALPRERSERARAAGAVTSAGSPLPRKSSAAASKARAA